MPFRQGIAWRARPRRQFSCCKGRRLHVFSNLEDTRKGHVLRRKTIKLKRHRVAWTKPTWKANHRLQSDNGRGRSLKNESKMRWFALDDVLNPLLNLFNQWTYSCEARVKYRRATYRILVTVNGLLECVCQNLQRIALATNRTSKYTCTHAQS